MSDTDKNLESSAMKDGLHRTAIKRIATSLAQCIPQFKAAQFQKNALKGIEPLELKARVHHIIGHIHAAHDLPFPEFCRALQNLPSVWDKGRAGDNKAAFAAWPVIDYIAVYGLEHPQESLTTLAKLTPLFTAEFAVRPFIKRYPELSYEVLQQWATHENEHVRRLASEGSRPRLPWGMQLPQFIKNPQPLEALLSQLKTDESLYVRRSVANNLNDISKDNTDWMIALCERWREEAHEHTDWIIKHALRSLVKAGDPRVFPLLGYTHKPKVKLTHFSIDKSQIHLGESVQLNVELQSMKSEQALVVDYVVYFMKANGQLAPKVFKWKNIQLPPNTTQKLQKTHAFKPISTRRYYAGLHQIAVQINGVEMARLDLQLTI